MSSSQDPKKSAKPVAINATQLMMRRILKNGDFYTCGICRSNHASQAHALSCLQTCWRLLLERAPWVVDVRSIGKQPFACNYCQRGYPTVEQAHSCAQDCVTKIMKSSSAAISTPNLKVNRPMTKPNTKASIKLAFKNLIARRKLADATVQARLENEKLKQIPKTAAPEIQNLVTEHPCENCKKTYATKEKADECLASHGQNSVAKS